MLTTRTHRGVWRRFVVDPDRGKLECQAAAAAVGMSLPPSGYPEEKRVGAAPRSAMARRVEKRLRELQGR